MNNLLNKREKVHFQKSTSQQKQTASCFLVQLLQQLPTTVKCRSSSPLVKEVLTQFVWQHVPWILMWHPCAGLIWQDWEKQKEAQLNFEIAVFWLHEKLVTVLQLTLGRPAYLPVTARVQLICKWAAAAAAAAAAVCTKIKNFPSSSNVLIDVTSISSSPTTNNQSASQTGSRVNWNWISRRRCRA